MRALTEAEREVRRNGLADHAAALFSETGYARLTVEAVARRAGVSKGAVFLAFASKEDLVLHAVGARFTSWIERLEKVDPSQPPAPLARQILGTIQADPHLMPLLALVNPVLEQGCSAEAVVRFKAQLASDLETLVGLWSARVPDLPVGAWLPLCLRLHALTVGAWTVGEASDQARSALEDRPDLQPLLTRFEDLFLPLVETQWAAAFPRRG